MINVDVNLGYDFVCNKNQIEVFDVLYNIDGFTNTKEEEVNKTIIKMENGNLIIKNKYNNISIPLSNYKIAFSIKENKSVVVITGDTFVVRLNLFLKKDLDKVVNCLKNKGGENE